MPIPPNIFYVEPPGIALDNTWMVKLAVQQRDLPDHGQVSGEQMFGDAMGNVGVEEWSFRIEQR